jgi:hypothetical protein
MEIKRVGSPSINYNVHDLKEETKFYLNGEPFFPAVRNYANAFISIPPVDEGFGEVKFKEGILLIVDESKLEDLTVRDTYNDVDHKRFKKEEKALKANLDYRKKRLELYNDFKAGKLTWDEFLEKAFSITDSAKWLREQKSLTHYPLRPRNNNPNQLMISREG